MKTYKFLKDNKAMSAMIGGIVALTVAVILVGSVVLPTIFNISTAGWNAPTIAMWGVVPILAIVYLYTIVMGP
jgi:TRAP-type mannitol/chloroaromatic compound transport system permease small subunit